MAFLRSSAMAETGPQLHGDRVMLRVPASGDFAEWARLRAQSRAFLVPWEPAWTSDELTRTAYRRRMRFYQRELREETGYPFFVFLRPHRDEPGGRETMVGGLSLSNVRRGVTQACTLGYWIGADYAGQGLMTEALRAAVPFAFDTLKLHRIEAACLPHNLASIRVLEKAGFQPEGLARGYLKINGVWQDHRLYALLDVDPRT